ncbi:MAG: ApaG domain [Holosporales bacterium]|jgi:uncharacterized protein affecting Mg2+/Co2+ transport|nr:ApaG domain [Holosporales bacterium]
MSYELVPVLQVLTTTIFLPHRSTPETETYTWMEESTIENRGLVTVQLRTRYRRLIGTDGFRTEVKDRTYGADGPVLNPSESISISQHFCAETSSGVLIYFYEVSTERGEVFIMQTPIYSFDSPLPYTVH